MQNKQFVLIVLLIAIVGTLILIKSFAATPATMWKPTADKPLKLTWILGDISKLTPDQVLNQQTKDLIGGKIVQADVYDIDGEYATKAQISYLQSKSKKVICYIDTGVWEDYRPDASKFPKSVIGKNDNGWNGSKWLDIRQISILEPIMRSRIQICKDKGFDSIEPDEMVNYTNDSGFPLTYNDQLKYNKAVASWAHEAGISIGLKDDHEQAHDLVDDFDWMLDEECWAFSECIQIDDLGPGGTKNGGPWDSTIAFSKKNKAVWIAEYPNGDNGNGQDYPTKERDKTTASQLTKAKTDQICKDSYNNRLNTAFYISGLPLDSGRTDCPPFPSRGDTGGGLPNPTVSVSAPSQTATEPANYSVSATSSELASIQITENSKVLKTCDNTTSCVVNVNGNTAGTYQYSAQATTKDSRIGTSNSFNITVNKATAPTNKPPTVTLTSDSSTDLKEPATFTLSADAKDTDGSITKVEFLLNGNVVNTLTKTPYTYKIVNLSYGGSPYAYTAKAYDNSGASAASQAVNVKVSKNIVTTPTGLVWPAGSALKLSFDGSNYPFWQGKDCSLKNGCSLNLSWNNATSDNSKVSSYEIARSANYENSKPYASVDGSTTTYKDPSITRDTSYVYRITAIDDKGIRMEGPIAGNTVQCFAFIFQWCGLK